MGHEFQVNTYTAHTQGPPAVAAGGDRRFVVAWESTETIGLADLGNQQTDAGSGRS